MVYKTGQLGNTIKNPVFRYLTAPLPLESGVYIHKYSSPLPLGDFFKTISLWKGRNVENHIPLVGIYIYVTCYLVCYIIPLPGLNPTYAYKSFRSNHTPKSQIPLSGVKYHSWGQIPCPGQIPPLTRGVFEKCQIPLPWSTTTLTWNSWLVVVWTIKTNETELSFIFCHWNKT